MKPLLAVPILGPTFDAAKEQMNAAAEICSILEVRIDLLPSLSEEELALLVKEAPLPLILTLRSKKQGGGFDGSDAQLSKKLLQLASLRPAYIDIETRIAKKLLHEIPAPVQIIVSHHDSEKTPHDLDGLFDEMKEQCPGAFLFKIATFANSTIDALRMLLFLKKKRMDGERLLGLCMGDLGKITRILSPLVDNPFTFAALSKELRSAPGQLCVEELADIYSYCTLSSKSIPFGLIGGFHIDASQSHIKHNASFRRLGFDGVYVKMKLRREELGEYFKLAKKFGFKGLSVTMPLKEEVIPYLDEIDPAAEGAGAVNTIAIEDDRLIGYNTDGPGGLDAIEEKVKIRGKKVLVIGCGGVGKALAFEAKRRRAKVTLMNRGLERGEKVSQELGLPFVPLDQIENELKKPYDILIQCTSCGMEPNVNETIVDANLLKPGMLVFDSVSRPQETRLIKDAKQRGCRVVDGVELFQRQGELQFKLWQIYERATV